MEKQKLLEILCATPNLIINEKTTGTSGVPLEFYVDVKSAYGNPDFLKNLTEYVFERLDNEITHIAVNGHGGIPFGAALGIISAEHGRILGITYVRDGVKGHGKQSYFDGSVPDKNSIVDLLDDVWTTGSSMCGNEKKYGLARRIEDTGAKVNKIWNVVLRADEVKCPYKHECIFTVKEVLDYLEKNR